MTLLVTIAPWALPPLIGACIGYITNSIAIRMLFRPLRETRILGIRVPFTPGVIPRQRHELAESIGDMVERELLTPEVFTRRFDDVRFAATLRRSIARFLDQIAETSLSDRSVHATAERALLAVRDGFRETIAHDPRLSSRVGELVSSTIVSSPGEARRDLVRRVLAIPFGVFAPVWRSHAIETMLGALIPRLDRPIVAYFDRPDVAREIDRRIGRILRYTIDQLTTMQRLVVTAGQFDSRLATRIPELRRRLVSEIRSTLLDSAIHVSIADTIRERLEERADLSIGDVLGPEIVATTIDLFVGSDGDAFLVALGNEVRDLIDTDTIATVIDRVIDRVRAAFDSDETVGDVLPVIRRRRGAITYSSARAVRRVLVGRVESLVASLDIRRVVIDRIDSLDVERVEELILRIVRRHLRWINLFGALLGALIGGVQVALSVLGIG